MSRVPAWTMAVFALLSIVFPAFAGSNDRIRIETRQIESVSTADITSLPHLPGGRGPVRGLSASADHEDVYAVGQWSFDSCLPEGWTSVDLTAQAANYWQVTDFSGFPPASIVYVPINGAQSMWLGNNAANSCSSTYPGYGDNWDQCLESREFSMTNDARISFFVAWHTLSDHITKLEYKIDGGAWTQIHAFFGGPQAASAETRIVASPTGGMGTYSIRFRFRFRSTREGSDANGFDTDGAIVIDDITVEEAGVGVHGFEDWEDEALGEAESDDGDWVGSATPAFGDYAGIFSGGQIRQEDICITKDCGWGFWLNSTALWDCVGPDPAVEFATDKPAYQFNEVQSPVIDVATGVPADASVTRLRFCVYRDLPLNDLIFFMVHARWSTDGVCWSEWQNDGFLYFGDDPIWDILDIDISEMVDPSAVYIQVGLAIKDGFDPFADVIAWSGCHRQGPVFDDVEVYRVDPNGPVFDVAAEHLFQDNFPGDGTITGTVRADMAADVALFSNPGIVIGDSVVANIIDPNGPLDSDGQFGGPAIYLHARDSGGKSGLDLQGGPRWPWVSGESSGGWSAYRFDQAYLDAGQTLPVADRYCVDLKDDIFEAGNVVEFYFSARSTSGATTYYSELTGTTNSEAAVRAQPMEFTCLPALAQTSGTEILFVNDAVGSDARDAMETAAAALGVQVDRYDVRAADKNVGNGPASRLINDDLLRTYYRKIVWSSGCDTVGTIGAGDATEKSDDFSLLFGWLSNSQNQPGLYLNGANIACEWDGIATASALSMRSTFMDFALGDCCHRDAGVANAPLVSGVLPLTFFQTSGVADLFTVDDGCPNLCCYDVIAPNSGAASYEIRYGGGDGAVLSQTAFNNPGEITRVVLSGFPFEEIQDDGVGVAEQALHLYRILDWMNCPVNPPTGIGRGGVASLRDGLAQNYPNPFNPSTTIRFSVKQRSRVTLRIYDVSGALVRTLVDREVAPSADGQQATWDGFNEGGRPAASGVYFYRLTAGGFSETRKLVLMK